MVWRNGTESEEVGEIVLEEGWEIVLEWVPGHVGIMENKIVDEEAKCGTFEGEEEEVGEILQWGEWESRRKRAERRSWKEFWVWKRKGAEYFGSGGKGEWGHEGSRWESKMLVWLRTNHGVMSGSRYFEERGFCKCGEKEDRDHYLLYCLRWRKEREKVWKDWDKGYFWEEGWVDMERMLFSEEGVKRVVEFGKLTGWKERIWKGGRWSKKEAREGIVWKPIVDEVGGWIGGWSEERRRREGDLRRERRKRYRKRVKESLVKSRVQVIGPIASSIAGTEQIKLKFEVVIIK